MAENILDLVFLLVMEESVAVVEEVPKVELLVDLVEDLQKIVVLGLVIIFLAVLVVLTLVVEVVVLVTHIQIQEVVAEKALL